MHFNVSQLMREPSGSTRSHEVQEERLRVNGAEALLVRGWTKLLRTDKGLWVSAVVETETPTACCRCVEEYYQPVRMTIEEETFPLVDPLTGAQMTVSGERDESLQIDQNHVLDLTEAVRQYTELAVPMKPVCRDGDCRGLCPSCGANLNNVSCLCEKATRDSRWGPLLDLVAAEPSK